MLQEIKKTIKIKDSGKSEALFLIQLAGAAGSDDQATKHAESMIKKGKFTWESILKEAEHQVKVARRTLHTFDTFTELDSFCATHETGKPFSKNGKECVYAY
jgi:hypothetical protein